MNCILKLLKTILLFTFSIFVGVSGILSCTRKASGVTDNAKQNSKPQIDSSVSLNRWEQHMYCLPKVSAGIRANSIHPFNASLALDYEIKDYKSETYTSKRYEDTISIARRNAVFEVGIGFELGSKRGFFMQPLLAASNARRYKFELGIGYNGIRNKSQRLRIRPILSFQAIRHIYLFNGYINNHAYDIRFQNEEFKFLSYKLGIMDVLTASFFNVNYSNRLRPQIQYYSFGPSATTSFQYKFYKNWTLSLNMGYYFPLQEKTRFRLRSNANAFRSELDSPAIEYQDNAEGASRNAMRTKGMFGTIDIGLMF